LVLESPGKISLKITHFFIDGNGSHVFSCSTLRLILWCQRPSMLHLNICGLQKGPGKFFMGVLESFGFFSIKEWEPFRALSLVTMFRWPSVVGKELYCLTVLPCIHCAHLLGVLQNSDSSFGRRIDKNLRKFAAGSVVKRCFPDLLVRITARQV